TTELARSNIQRPYIKFTMNRPSGRTVLEAADVSKAFGDLEVIPDFSAIVNRGEKIVLVGRNAQGKTTLLKALLADAPGQPPAPGDVDGGKIRWGHEVSIGYFAQDSTGALAQGTAAAGGVDGGKIRWGHEVSIGYFAQDSTGAIAKGMTAVEWLHQFDPDAHRQDTPGLLGPMLFSGEES